MKLDGGFVDLRVGRHESGAEDTFWPSFTDIMTVIVMIFLLAMVVLLIRNMELVNELRATMEAERSAADRHSPALANRTGALIERPPRAPSSLSSPPQWRRPP